MSVSLCVLRIEVDEDLPEMADTTVDVGKSSKKVPFKIVINHNTPKIIIHH